MALFEMSATFCDRMKLVEQFLFNVGQFTKYQLMNYYISYEIMSINTKLRN